MIFQGHISRSEPVYAFYLFLGLVLFLKFNTLANAVPVIPNEAILTGTIKEYCLTSASLSGISPEQILYRLVISVEEVEDVKGYPNSKIGKPLVLPVRL